MYAQINIARELPLHGSHTDDVVTEIADIMRFQHDIVHLPADNKAEATRSGLRRTSSLPRLVARKGQTFAYMSEEHIVIPAMLRLGSQSGLRSSHHSVTLPLTPVSQLSLTTPHQQCLHELRTPSPTSEIPVMHR